MRRKAWRSIEQKVLLYIGGEPTGLGCRRSLTKRGHYHFGRLAVQITLGTTQKTRSQLLEAYFLVDMSLAEQGILEA
jgi:hypothetical protein